MTDEAGEFAFRGLEVGTTWKISAFLEGHAPAPGSQLPLLAPAGAVLEIRLAPLGVIAGQVVLDDGPLPPSFAIEVVGSWRRPGQPSPVQSIQESHFANPQGRFELQLERDPGEVFRVVATAPGCQRGQVPVLSFDPLGYNDVGVILLRRGGSLRVTVLGPGSVPLAGAWVEIRHPVPEHTPRQATSWLSCRQRQMTDEHGETVFDNLDAGLYTLTATHPATLDGSGEARVPERGEALPMTLVLGRGGTIHGQVLDGAGAPLAGVEVDVSGHGPGLPSRQSRTDEAGRYRAEGLAAGEYSVGASVGGEGDRRVARTVDMPPDGEVLCNLQVRSGCRVTGVLRGWQPELSTSRRATLELHSPRGQSERVRVTGQVQADGSFGLAPVPPGDYVLYPPYLEDLPVRVPDAATHRIMLDLPGGSLQGRVRRADGEPLRGNLFLSVQERAGDGTAIWQAVHCDQDTGEFLAPHLPPGTYDVRAELRGLGCSLLRGIEVEPGAQVTGLELVLQAGALLLVSVRDPAGNPVPRATLTLWHDLGTSRNPAPQQEEQPGEWRLHPLVPGTYRVVADSAQHGVTWQDGVRVPEDGEARATLVCGPAGGPVRVRVTEEREPADALLTLLDGSSRPILRRSSSPWHREPDGAVTLGRLPPGHYTIRIEQEDGSTALEEITILAAGPGILLEVRLE
jgi:protocatechuate 3,4-dioxygenase beta subunit